MVRASRILQAPGAPKPRPMVRDPKVTPAIHALRRSAGHKPSPRTSSRLSGLGAVGGRSAGAGRVHRFRGPVGAFLRGPLHALHRDRMAPGALELGPRLRHRGRPSVPRFRLPESRALRGGRLHRARERALAGRDGAARHAPRRSRGLRPSQTPGGAPAAAARALPPEARGRAAPPDCPGAAVAGPLRLASCIERRAAPTCAPLQVLPSHRGVCTEMKQRKVSTDSDRARLQSLNEYLERNFPDFFAEARFQIGDDDYFLYARFGQYLARTIEQNRASGRLINRGFTVLNRMARASARNPRIRQMLVSGPLEYILDAPRARALARKRLCATAQGYLESLCE